jgi:hypothetical protein
MLAEPGHIPLRKQRQVQVLKREAPSVRVE